MNHFFLQNIPTNWIVSKHSKHFTTQMGKTILKKDLLKNGEIPVYSATKKGEIFGYVNEINCPLKKGDIVIPARGSIGFVKYIEDDAATSTQTTIQTRCIDKNINTRFIYLYMTAFKDYLFECDKTAIPQITVTQISNNPVIIPPIEIQKSIVNFLNKKISHINQLIEKKQKMTDNLEEQKSSIISELIDSGASKNNNHEESKLVKLNAICDIVNGSTPLRSRKDYWENGAINWFTVADIRASGEEIFDTKQKITELALKETSSKLLPKNTVLLCCTASIGETAIARVPMTTNQQFNGLIPNLHKVTPEYLKYFCQTLKHKLLSLSGKSTINFVSIDKLKKNKILLPPIKNQKYITEILDNKISHIDKTIDKIKKSIEKLHELKISIITEAVTGQLNIEVN